MRYSPLDQVVAALVRGEPPHPESGFLGGDPDPEQSALILLPVPWEVTTSYGGGTAMAPEAIRRASHQLDLEDGAFGTPYCHGISLTADDGTIERLNRDHRPLARQVIESLERGNPVDPAAINAVNHAGARLNQLVAERASHWLERGRAVGVVGGDHAAPYGLIEALSRHHPQFGILHIDAHHDLRPAYEGFEWSHASIMHNVLERIANVVSLVQVGIRDYSAGERRRAAADERIDCHYSDAIFRRRAGGTTFAQICHDILGSLPPLVYISFDIDGLDPANCPSTGTPVPGGLSCEEAGYLLEQLVASGRRVIGFDLCEVAPDDQGGEWDANVGARILYRLCGALLAQHRPGELPASLPLVNRARGD